jgi:hypothetical protein
VPVYSANAIPKAKITHGRSIHQVSHNEIALLENALQYDVFLRTGAGLISDAHAQAIEDAARAHLETLKAMAKIRASTS